MIYLDTCILGLLFKVSCIMAAVSLCEESCTCSEVYGIIYIFEGNLLIIVSVLRMYHEAGWSSMVYTYAGDHSCTFSTCFCPLGNDRERILVHIHSYRTVICLHS